MSSTARPRLAGHFAAAGVLFILLALLFVPATLWKTSAQSGEKKKGLAREGTRRSAGAADLKTQRLRRQGGDKNSSGKSPMGVEVAPPNDQCAGAIALSPGQTVDGTLADAINDYELSGDACFTGIGQIPSDALGRDVVYSFTAPATTTYSFRIYNFDLQYDYMIYTASACPGGPLPAIVTCQNASDRNVFRGPTEEVLCQPMTAGQTVLIFVDEYVVGTATETFKIEVTQCVPETEANNTPATATPYIFGMEGSLQLGTDVDFFSLGAPVAGSRIFALLDGSSGIEQSTNDNFDLRVTTTTDTLEYDDRDADLSFGSFSAAIGGTPLTGAATFLRVNSFGVTANEPYRLYAITRPPGVNSIAACVTQTTSAIDETEPNDSLAQANTGPLGYFEGSISATTDADIFSFTASAGDLIFASLDVDPCRNNTPFDGDILLYDSGQNLLDLAEDGGSTSNTTPGPGSLLATTPFSPAEGLTYRIQTTGTYYIVVIGVAAGDYLLAISRNANVPSAAGGVVSGRILDSSGTPIEGVIVRLNGEQTRKTITDAKGRYYFDSVEANRFYTVTPSRVNYNFNPFNRSFTQLSNHTDAAFSASFSGDGANPLDTPEYFVRQQYVDLLGREPDEGGFNYWSNEILRCGNDADCVQTRRSDIAAAFFIEQEFQQSGAFIYNLYKGSLGRRPAYSEYAADRRQVVGGPNLNADKVAFANSFVQRPEFVMKYQANTTPESFVDALLEQVWESSKVALGGDRGLLLAIYGTGSNTNQSRSLVLQHVIAAPMFKEVEYNPAFVLTEYFGYLRRNPEPEGYDFWLNVLNNREPGNFRGMVCSFITSTEYQKRFSSVVTHSNAECGR